MKKKPVENEFTDDEINQNLLLLDYSVVTHLSLKTITETTRNMECTVYLERSRFQVFYIHVCDYLYLYIIYLCQNVLLKSI